MAAPITGPHTKVNDGGMTEYRYKRWFRQKRPYNEILPFQTVLVEGYPTGEYQVACSRSANYLSQVFSSEASQVAFNKAYAKFLDKLGENASLGVTLAQWKQADGMIGKRAAQLLAFTSALVRGSPVGVARALGISLRDVQAVMRTKHGLSRKISDLWLEFHFGWKPLVKDIYAACEVLNEPLPSSRITGSGSYSTTSYRGTGGPATEQVDLALKFGAKIGASVMVTNPNLRLMQQMGILNPAVVVFDAVKWSFVFGWFHSIQEYLSSFTDFAGLTLSDAYISKRVTGTISYSWIPCDKRVQPSCTPEMVETYKSWLVRHEGMMRERTKMSEIPRPYFVRKELKLSPIRALTSISLLVQKLPRA
jgi:hypothetical protein